MLDALVGGVDVVADRGANPGKPADEDSALRIAAENSLADLTRLVRIVDPHGVRIRAEIDDLVCCKGVENGVSQQDAAMVESNRNPHDWTVPHGRGLESLPRMAVMDATQLRELGQQFRVDSVCCAAAAKSGHPTSGMSAADLMAVLLANHLRYDFDTPDLAANDRLIFSKGHASTLLYAMFRAAGAITDEELLEYRTFDSMLERCGKRSSTPRTTSSTT